MPHAALRIVDGVDLNRTPALNEAGLSSSQLIRFQPDDRGNILAQKLGGWDRFYNGALPAVPRALWAWEDTESTPHLAVGTQNIGTTYQARLGVITNGSLQDVTPRSQTDNITPVLTSVAGNSVVTITDATITDITRYDAVYIPAHIAIGGVVLFGLYACDPDGHSGTTTYTVQATDILGEAIAAASSSSSPTVAEFATTSGSSLVTVTLAGHGYSVGSFYPVLIETTVGGVTFFGHYPVQSVVDADNFTITGTTEASGATTGFINGGKAQYVYSFGIGAIPAGSGFGVGGFGTGGFGRGTGITPSTGNPIRASDWSLDNWGEFLVACPTTDPVVLTTSGTSGTGVTGTITHTETYTVPMGQVVTVAGVTPSTWNGTHTTTATSSSSVSFATTLTSSQTGAGTITVQQAPFQPIYVWDAESGAPIASAIPQAPPVNEGVFVAMPQKQIIAYGSTFTGIPDPLLVRWCDVNNYNVWAGMITNQAGSYRIPRGSRIVGGMQTAQQGLIWTDLGLWSMQYIGQPFIYSFNEIGVGCGLIGKKAAGTLAGEVFWMGPSQFFTLGGDGVVTLPCDVWDFAFQQVDTAHASRIRTAVNSRFNEIAWYFPTTGSNGEVSAYVKYNVVAGKWDYGTLGRSAWIDQSVLGPPIGGDPSSLLLYQHETSPDADGQAMSPSFRTGYFAVSEGEYLTFIDQFWPDFKYGSFGSSANATVQITFYTANYPGDTPVAYGPYSITQASQFITTRIRARLVAFEVSSSDVGSFWRLGDCRYRFAPDGKF